MYRNEKTDFPTTSDTRRAGPVLHLETGIPHHLPRPGRADILHSRALGLSVDIRLHLYQRDAARRACRSGGRLAFLASPEVAVVAHCADMEEAKLAMRERNAYGIVYLPETFSDDIAAGRQTQVSLFCDMSGLMYYKALLSANTEVSLEMNAEIKTARAGNTTERQDQITVYPIEYKDIALYNPTNGFAAFLLPAVLMLVIQQTLLLGIGLSAGTAREKNQFRDLVPINRHYNGTLRIVFGKGLSYFMVYSLVAVYVLCVVPWIFRLNRIAIPGELILFTLPYLSACIFFSMTASIAIRNRETCMLIFVFTSVPLLALLLLPVPVHVRHQRLRAHQQHGRHTE